MRVFAILKRIQRNEHRASVGKIGADQQIVARKFHCAVHAWNGASDFTGAANDFLAALQARAIGQLREDDQVAGILRRDKTGGHGFETAPGQQKQTRINQQRNAPTPDCSTDGARVTVPGAIKTFIEKTEEPAEDAVHPGSKPVLSSVMSLQ